MHLAVYIIENNQLYHYGKKGMHWGDRLYQYKDGTLTPLGRLRYRKGKVKETDSSGSGEDSQKSEATQKEEKPKKPKKKKISEMTDDELRAATNRLKLENDYNKEKQNSKTVGQGVVSGLLRDIGTASVKNIGTQFVTYQLGTLINKIFAKDGEPIVNPKKGQKDK